MSKTVKRLVSELKNEHGIILENLKYLRTSLKRTWAVVGALSTGEIFEAFRKFLEEHLAKEERKLSHMVRKVTKVVDLIRAIYQEHTMRTSWKNSGRLSTDTYRERRRFCSGWLR